MTPFAHAIRRGLRTVLQLAAGGALTGLIDLLAHGLDPGAAATIMAAWTAIVAALQNGLEQAGSIPTILPTSPAAPPAAEGP